jgi:hypothetical protein
MLERMEKFKHSVTAFFGLWASFRLPNDRESALCATVLVGEACQAQP